MNAQREQQQGRVRLICLAQPSSMFTTTRVLSAVIGTTAAYHLQTIQVLLPALYTSLLSQLQTLIIPPLIIILLLPVTRRLPPILSLIPLLIFPPISAASFPLTDLILFSTLFALTYLHDPLPTSLAFLINFASTSIPVRIPSNILSILPSPSHLPILITALTATNLAARAATLATITSPRHHASKSKRSSANSGRRRRTLPQPILLTIFFTATLLLTTIITPPLTTLIRRLNPRPLPQNFKLLDQARGVTGLISVVEAVNGHRMLTADMSVLGGYHVKQGYYPDSIFGQFYVHEAVRLSRQPGEPEETQGGRDGRALCIGVGVGVVANALHHHSSIVHPVELDPVVARFAKTWFNVQPRIIVADGIRIVAETKNETYDFVIHDVFTGGSVATHLFSVATFQDIKRVMKKDGVLAVNFVGGVAHPPTPATGATALAYVRLKQVFGNVRAFSDGLDSGNHNVVFFAGAAGEVTFRKPVEGDWLGSPARKEMLEQFEKHEVGDILAKVDVGDASDWLFFAGMWDIAAEHREIMRQVHPTTLWRALLAAEKRS